MDKGSVAIWRLGQNGYIFKTPEGTLVSTVGFSRNTAHLRYTIAGIVARLWDRGGQNACPTPESLT